jgi:Flp pilus assembly protein TadB
MAKKARRKLEDEEEQAFEFPVFDEKGFAKKEFEIGSGVVLVGILTVAIGLVSWMISTLGVTVWVPLAMGIAVIALSPFLVMRLRDQSSLYTKGDWAGLLALEFFGWFALWFLLLNLTSAAV